MTNKPGTHPTWKPDEVAEPWKTSDFVRAARKRRLLMRKGRIQKHRQFYYEKKPLPLEPMHHGPCIPTRVTIEDKRGIVAKFLRFKKGKRTRLLAGCGHRLKSFDRYGNPVWHPRMADVKVCLVCKRTFVRTTGTRPGEGAV